MASNQSSKQFDVLIIGGGPGGYTAAIRCAQLGMTVGLVEKADLGGVCLNWGCIPTKSLLHTADVIREIGNADELGINVKFEGFDLDLLVKRSRTVANQLNKGVIHLMRKNKIEVIHGSARLKKAGLVEVDDIKIEAKNIIVATGASAKDLPLVKADGKLIWTAREAMTPTFLPKNLLIVGAGAIGVEFASFYATLGSKVTMVEVLEQILPAEDAEIAEIARVSLMTEGIDVRTGVGIEDVKCSAKKVTATIQGDKEKYDAMILSVGVAGNLDALNVEKIGLATDKGFVRVDSRQQTNIAGIYAIGDVAGVPCLAHKASHEGVIAAEVISGLNPHPLNQQRIPGCTYGYPQIASIGLTQAQAEADNRKIRIGHYPFSANGKAVALNDTNGLVKTIFDAATGELLGAHLIGPGVTELIQGFAVAMGLETTEAELMQTIFPHPTISEAMHESVLSAYGRAINY